MVRARLEGSSQITLISGKKFRDRTRKYGIVCSQTAMKKSLERFGEVRIFNETNGFGLDFVKKTESGFWSTTPDEKMRKTCGLWKEKQIFEMHV